MILEALSATGLRSIRYAKEIPLVESVFHLLTSTATLILQVSYVIANDLSPLAIEAMRRNVGFNGLGPTTASELGKVRVNEGDAWWVPLN